MECFFLRAAMVTESKRRKKRLILQILLTSVGNDRWQQRDHLSHTEIKDQDIQLPEGKKEGNKVPNCQSYYEDSTSINTCKSHRLALILNKHWITVFKIRILIHMNDLKNW